MNERLVECVANFSEGRDASVIESLRAAIDSTASVRLLDIHIDRWHHRSVFTFVGRPMDVENAAFAAADVAVAAIDLNRHTGEHPRMGAADVIPFVPLGDTTVEDCAAVARRLGARIGDELHVPVYLYGLATTNENRRRLPAIRRGGFERLRSGLTDKPDFGPSRVHPTAGATAVGVRHLMVAYNVLLDTNEVAQAERIAAEIRESGGGMPGVQARGFLIDGRAQVSMNLHDLDSVTPADVFDVIRQKAVAGGAAVLSSEIVGLIPERALHQEDRERLLLKEPAEDHLLEEKLGRVTSDENSSDE
jgi:glutamate formiminotransferase